MALKSLLKQNKGLLKQYKRRQQGAAAHQLN